MKTVKNIFHLISAVIANFYFGFPSRKLTVIGITGTDGKTTTANFTHAILTASGLRTGLISTISAKFGDKEIDTGFHVTSPDAWDVQKILRQMVNEGMTHVVLEVTSHAITQHRFWGISFEVTALTNITHEHLDYHKDFESYKKTKLSFLESGAIALKAEDISDGLLQGIEVKLLGSYNLLNAKLAAAIALSLHVPPEFVKKGIESVTFLAGRMEVVHSGVFKVVVDFAHTPNGLYNALTSARKMIFKDQRLIVVFGCAGERDVTKRFSMGSISAELSDFQVITAEDPRSEDVNTICQNIARGIEDKGGIKGKTYIIEPDRFKAINYALMDQAKEGDLIIITGKGHEKSMNLDGKTETPWSDQEAVQKILKRELF